jgi:hypothetical protein
MWLSIRLRVVAGDERQEGRLSGAIGTFQLPTISLVYLPRNLAQNLHVQTIRAGKQDEFKIIDKPCVLHDI